MSYNPYYSEFGSENNVAAGRHKHPQQEVAGAAHTTAQQPQTQPNGSFFPTASTNMAFQFGQTA